MAALDMQGRIWYPQKKDGSLDITKRPQLKRYLDEMEGGVMGCVWTDISPINSQAQERLGYPVDGNQLCDLGHATLTILFYRGLRAMAQSGQSLDIGI
jgi:hypothetical protein